MAFMPVEKYKPFPQIDLPDRQWPTKTITECPTWCSVDLRDGNQALIEPMTARQKSMLWDQLVKVGFKEIEDFGPDKAFQRYFKGRQDGLRPPGIHRLMKAVLGSRQG